MATFSTNCTVWILSLQTLCHIHQHNLASRSWRGHWRRWLEMHTTPMRSGHPLKAMSRACPKQRLQNERFLNPWASMQWISHRWLGLMPSKLMGTALNPKSHTIQPLAQCIQF